MEIDVNRLTPGMVVQKDVVGKSGKPIVPRDTELNDLHIKFIKKFLIKKVSVSPLNINSVNNEKTVENLLELNQKKQVLSYVFNMAVQSYKEIFQRVENNMALEMYKVREKWIPIFQEIVEKPVEQIVRLMDNRSNEQTFYTRNVVMTFLTVTLVKKLGFEQKDWLQIGFAALLSNIGIAKLPDGIHSIQDENWRLHPIYSYQLVEKEVTINKQAKLAILQHHEYLDGTGFPSGHTKEKIHIFSQVIAVTDYFVTSYENNKLNKVINSLKTYKNSKFLENVVDTFLNELDTNN